MMESERLLGRMATRRTVLGAFAGLSASAAFAACRIVAVETDDADDEVPPIDEDDDSVDPSVEEDDDTDVEPPDDDDVDVEPPDDDDDDDDDLDPDEDEEPEDVDDEDVPEEDDEPEDADPEDEEPEEDEEVEDEPVEGRAIVGDVIDFTLGPDGRWEGPFGSVTMRLHRGWVNGEDVTFIRTDASDNDFAEREGLVFAPLIGNALDEPDSYSDLYLFPDPVNGQLPVMSSSPADGERFSPAFRVHYVYVTGKSTTPLASVDQIMDAAFRHDVRIERTTIIVNYPVVTWPGGQIPVDNARQEALGGGQLLEAPDIDGGRVTLKLHQCYPGSRYIITDTSALGMAPMMGAGEAGGSQLLIDADAVAPIYVFLNGLEGTGAMGYQPGVFNVDAGDPAWSPFWEHLALEWANPDEAVAVTSEEQIEELVAAGDLIRYAGTPETDPDSFVVNCSVPVLAPVTWQPAE